MQLEDGTLKPINSLCSIEYKYTTPPRGHGRDLLKVETGKKNEDSEAEKEVQPRIENIDTQPQASQSSNESSVVEVNDIAVSLGGVTLEARKKKKGTAVASDSTKKSVAETRKEKHLLERRSTSVDDLSNLLTRTRISEKKKGEVTDTVLVSGGVPDLMTLQKRILTRNQLINLLDTHRNLKSAIGYFVRYALQGTEARTYAIYMIKSIADGKPYKLSASKTTDTYLIFDGCLKACKIKHVSNNDVLQEEFESWKASASDDKSEAIVLREYQEIIVAKVKRKWKATSATSVLVYLPTGGGKTVIASKLLSEEKQMRPNSKIFFVANRQCISAQTGKMLERFGIENFSYIAAGHKTNDDASVFIVSIQTFARRWKKDKGSQLPADVDLIIIDEAHGSSAPMYCCLRKCYPSARILGLTATPFRLDDQNLGHLYDSRIDGPTVRKLIDCGYLVEPIYIERRFGTSSTLRTKSKSAVVHWKKHCSKLRTVAFCQNIAAAELLASHFEEMGVSAKVVVGSTKKVDREIIFGEFKCGRVKVLCTVDALSEGFDEPRIEAILMMRRTDSLARYIQQIGRGLRPCQEIGKTKCFVLDEEGNVALHGKVDSNSLRRKFEVAPDGVSKQLRQLIIASK